MPITADFGYVYVPPIQWHRSSDYVVSGPQNYTLNTVRWVMFSLGCHIHNGSLPSILVGLVGLALWLMSEIALNKYRCEYRTI